MRVRVRGYGYRGEVRVMVRLTLYRPMTAFAVMTQCASNDQ